MEHKEGENKFLFIIKAIANGLIKVINFIVSLLKYCANFLYALIKRFTLFIRKKMTTNIELIKKVSEKMRNDQAFLNTVNNTSFTTTCFFPELFSVFLQGSSNFIRFLAELTYLIEKSTVKTDFERINPPKQTEQLDNEIEGTIFTSVPQKISEEVQKFANFGGTGSIYIAGGSEKDKQTSKSVAESIARKKALFVVADAQYRQDFNKVRGSDSRISNQVWLNYCLNTIENVNGLNELTKSLSNVSKGVMSNIKVFKKLNHEYSQILSGKKSIELEKAPGQREQIRIGESPETSDKAKALWNKVVIDHCKKQVIITHQIMNLLQFASNFSSSIGKYCAMGYNNVCIEASKFAWKFRKLV